MRKRKVIGRTAVTAAVLAVLFAIGSTFAYFTDKDQVTNHFTVGDVEISVEEPNWDPEEAQNITPNKELAKDPAAVNEGVNDAYVFMAVTIPKANVRTANEDGTLNDAADQELFTYLVKEGWTLVSTDAGDAQTKYTYAYVDGQGSMNPVAPGQKTGSLFDSVKFINLVEGQLDQAELDIDVDVLAIQTSDLGTEDPQEIYQIIVNQQA